MSDAIQIRKVNVEFLRAGPPHNQLLSPLTQYLAVCGDSGAGVVTVPYEHAEFQRRLKELRYETGDAGDRQAMLHKVGVDVGELLGKVPGLPGSLTVDPSKTSTLVQLRLTLSASELASLPWELAKVPVGPGTTSESWLAIQTRPPVCLTRSIRTVSSEGVVWPHNPRILFIAGDRDVVPFDEHKEALVDAILPFRYPDQEASVDPRKGRIDPREALRLPTSSDDGIERYGELLTILKNPTLAQVLQEFHKTPYTHVHILTHGDQEDMSRESYGLVLRGQDGADDVVSGERFASALTVVADDGVRRPAVVTVASCDSANVGTVTIPGASFAHALHQSGIPLVVASQFPLSKEASVPLARELYRGLLWGEHPLLLLHRLRAELHARYNATWHDWASLVVYEALPHTFGDQLEKLRYYQTRRAMDSALERIDRAVQRKSSGPLRDLDAAIETAVKRLPLAGQYAVECMGLRASANKRLAQYAFELTRCDPKAKPWRDPFDLLERSWVDYGDAVKRLLVNDGGTVQRVATLHWVLVQAICIGAVLGKPDDRTGWSAAELCAQMYRAHPDLEERAWAYASLAELHLVRLAWRNASEEVVKKSKERAHKHVDHLIAAYPFRSAFPIKSTLRQLQRYVEWWGDPRFERALCERGGEGRANWALLIETARELIRKLNARNAPEPPAQPGGPPDGGFDDGAGASDGRSAPSASAGGRRSRGSTRTLGSGPHGKRSPGAGASASLRPKPARTGTFFDVEMLPAGHGDALWIEYGDAKATHRLLVDCGTQNTVGHLLGRVEQLRDDERRLELFVMTHIDADHIGGALPFFRAVKAGLRFDDVWFNGWRHLSGSLGARQGEMFSTAIDDFNLPWNQWRDRGAIAIDGDALPSLDLPGGMKLTLLSPRPAELRKLAPVWEREVKRYGLEPGARVDYGRFLKGTPSTSTDVDALAEAPFKPDAGAPNGTSIALLAEYEGGSVLLGADAYAPVLVESIKRLLQQRKAERLKLDAFKVAHHGSKNNLSGELIALLDCRRYLISSNGEYFCHPDREAIARIVKHGGHQPSLHFNYRSRYNEVWARSDLQERYSYTANFPADPSGGIAVPIVGSTS